MTIRRKIAYVAAAILLLSLAALWVLQSAWLKARVFSYIARSVQQQYALRLEADSFDFSLADGLSVSAGDLRVSKAGDPPFLKVMSLSMKVPYSILWSSETQIDRFVVTGLFLDLDRLPELPSEGQSGSSAGLRIGEIQVRDSEIIVLQKRYTGVNLQAAMTPGEVVVRNLSANYRTARMSGSGSILLADPLRYKLEFEVAADASLLADYADSLPPVAGPIKAGGHLDGQNTDIDLDLTIHSDALAIAGSDAFPLQGKVKYASASQTEPLSVSLTWRAFPLAVIHQVVPSVPLVHSRSDGELQYTGGLEPWGGSGFLRTTMQKTDGTLPLSGGVDAELANGAVTFRDTHFSSRSVLLALSGSLKKNSLHLNVDARAGTTADLAVLAPDLVRYPVAAGFLGTVSGEYDDLKISGKVDAKSRGSSVQLNGSYNLGSNQFRGEFEGVAEAEILQLAGITGAQGFFDIRGTGSGSISKPVISADVNAREVVFEGVRIGDIDASLTGNGRELRADLQIPELSTRVEGVYSIKASKFDIQGAIQRLNPAAVRSFLPQQVKELTGEISASFQLSGDIRHWKDAEGEFQFDDSKLSLSGFDINIPGGSRIHLVRQNLDVDLQAIAREGELHVTGTVPVDSGTAKLQAVTDLDLTAAGRFLEGWEVTGKIHAQIEMEGTPANPVLHGFAEIRNAGIADSQKRFQFSDANGRIELKEDRADINLHGSLQNAPLQVTASLPLQDGAARIQMRIEALNLATIMPDSDVAGLFDLEVRAEGKGLDPKQWTGRAALKGSEVRLGANNVTLREPVSVELNNGTLTVLPFQLNAQGLLDFNGKGSLQLHTQELNAEIEGQGDLSLLSSFAPSIQGSGLLDVGAAITGTITAPVFHGSLKTSGAMLRVPGYPFVLEEVNLDAPFDASGLRVNSFSARLGGGTVEGEGELPLLEGKPGSFRFKISGRNVGWNYPEGLRGQADASLQLAGTLENPVLSGNVEILRSRYSQDIDYRDRLINTLLAQKELLAPATGAASRLKLDLVVTTRRDFQVKNNLAALRSSADLRILGTATQPRISGNVSVREGGNIGFEGNNFYVDHAEILFPGSREFNPEFDALLTTTVVANDRGERQAFEIGIPLRGTFDDLGDTVPYSDPDLSTSQIYSLLLTGSTGELKETASTIFQQQFAAYLSGKLLFDFQRRIAAALGLSRFEILPTDLISSEQDPGARLLVGREVAPGLDVQYSTLLSQNSEGTWVVSYRPGNRFQILFVDQEDGAYTVGLRHTLRFGGSAIARSSRSWRGRPQISSIELAGTSPLSENMILKTLQLSEGQRFNFWKLDDRAEEIRKNLQKQGYLFPLIEIEETRRQAEVDLRITVSDRGRREMEFKEIDVDSDRREQYLKWWREGFSESTVLLQITDDLLQELHRGGYHQANLRSETVNESPNRIVYRFLAERGPRLDQAEITFSGNPNYSSHDLIRDLSAIYGSREEMILDALHDFPAFSDGVVALYVRKGYLDVQVDPGPATFRSGTAMRKVRIQEGQSWLIAERRFSGDPVVPDELLNRLQLKAGSLYDSQQLSEDEMTITDFYHEEGYRNVRVAADIRRGAEGQLVLSYDLQPGEIARIGSIRIAGNDRTRSGLIEKQIKIKSGDVLTPGGLILAQNNVAALQLFRQVQVEPQETETAGVYDVEVRVVESPPYSIRYGLRYDSELDTEGEVQFYDKNLFGIGGNVTLYGRWSSLDTTYRMILHSAPEARRRQTLSVLPWRSLLSLSYIESEKPTFLSKQTIAGIQRRWELFGPLVVLANLKFEQGRVTSKLSGGPIDFDLKQKVTRLIGIALMDFRDDPLNPRRGFFVSNEIEHAPDFLGSDLVFTKNYTQYFQYFSLGPVVSASAARLGIAGDLIGSEHFFAGGQGTIRGFKLNEVGPRSRVTGDPIGGEAVLILNQEFHFPVYSWMGGVVFYDAGNVYATLSDFSLSDLRHTAGIGLRLNSPYGILRMDAGFNLDPLQNESSYVLHFGLGQAW